MSDAHRSPANCSSSSRALITNTSRLRRTFARASLPGSGAAIMLGSSESGTPRPGTGRQAAIRSLKDARVPGSRTVREHHCLRERLSSRATVPSLTTALRHGHSLPTFKSILDVRPNSPPDMETEASLKGAEAELAVLGALSAELMKQFLYGGKLGALRPFVQAVGDDTVALAVLPGL